MQRTKVLIIGAGLLLAASTAFAEGEGEAPPPPDGNGSAAVPAGGGDFGSLWSQMVIDRPFVVAKGKLGFSGNLDILRSSTPGVMGMPGSSSTGEGLDL